MATRLQVTVDPKTLQVADQATQQVAAYIGLLVESYNRCALSPEEYRARLAELNPLKTETTHLTGLLGDIKSGQAAQQRSLNVALRQYAQLSQQLPSKLAELDRKVEQIKTDVTAIRAESQMEGLLLPAADPDPPSRCPAPPAGMTKVFLGSDFGAFSASPFEVVTLGSPVLTVNIVEGGLSVDATVTGSDGRVIVQIVRNRFSVNRNNYLRREIPDKSTLVVTDQYGKQALYVRYLNPHAIKVLGIFREPATSASPDTWVMTVTDDQTTMSGRDMSNVTFGGNCQVAGHGIYSYRLGPPPHRQGAAPRAGRVRSEELVREAIGVVVSVTDSILILAQTTNNGDEMKVQFVMNYLSHCLDGTFGPVVPCSVMRLLGKKAVVHYRERDDDKVAISIAPFQE